MKITKSEGIALMITVLVLMAMTFYFLGSRSAAEPVRVIVRETVVNEPEEQESGEEAVQTAQTETEEKNVYPIDVNTAMVEELMLLPGIGEERAKAIVRHRVKNGPFTSVEELSDVEGIGAGILERIIDQVTIGDKSNG